MLSLTIATPGRSVVRAVKVQSVTIPGAKGEMTILPGHARLLSTLGTGVFSFDRENGKKEYAVVSKGFMQVHEDHVTVLGDILELAHEIDVEQARRAQELAEEKLKAKEHFEENLEHWQHELQLALFRQEVAQYLLPPH